jgi:hypothetical protein
MSDYHRFVPPMGTTRYSGLTHQQILDSLPAHRVDGWQARLASLSAEPFNGVTTDGQAVPGLFSLRDEGAPTAAILEAVSKLLALLSAEQARAVLHPIESDARRKWVNEVPRFERYGIWLDEVTPPVRDAALNVLRASLSTTGYEKSRDLMRLNGFLGELVGAPIALGEYCYQMHVFGQPSSTEPWGWQLYGHHLCLTCLIVGTQMTLTPTFMGAEPRYADSGPHSGTRVFEDEERIGLELVRSLTRVQQTKAIVYDTTVPDGLPPGRHQGTDGMTLSGAFKDNAVIPYEGIRAGELDSRQVQVLLGLAERYLSTLPPGPLRARMSDVERHIAQTHFCWAGGIGDDSTFYYRIHSPVVMIEFDHHKGVLLTNETPQRFHIHTIVRTPNGNDYGMDLLRLHYETSPHHKHPTGGGEKPGIHDPQK